MAQSFHVEIQVFLRKVKLIINELQELTFHQVDFAQWKVWRHNRHPLAVFVSGIIDKLSIQR